MKNKTIFGSSITIALFICLINTNLVSANIEPVYYGPDAGYYDHNNDSGNVGIGSSALFNTTYGSVYNTALGSLSLYSNLNGSNNTAVGFNAGSGDIDNAASLPFKSFSNGTFLGFDTGSSLTTGSNNLFLGFKAGDEVTTGSKNIIIGYDVDAPSPTGSNQLNIGNTIYGDTLAGNIQVRGNVSANQFFGDGSKLTNISSSSITGTINANNALRLVSANNTEVVKAENSNLLRFSNTDYLKMFLLGSMSPSSTKNIGFAFTQSNDTGASSFSAPIYVGGIHVGGSYNAATVAPPVDGEIRTLDGTAIHVRPNNISSGTIFDRFGNVGIGINPTEKLTVNGNIKASKTMTDVLSLAPRTTPPVAAVAGDIYAYQSGTTIALCMYSGEDWVKIGGTAVSCPRVNYTCKL